VKRGLWALLLALASVGAARADKLILIPTADMSRIQAEYSRSTSSDDLEVITAQLGFGRGFELLGRRYQNVPGGDDATEIGGELQLLPEGLVTPGLAAGVWDISGNSPRGRRAFLVLTKTLPLVDWLPFPVKNVKFHAGVGTGSLSVVFLGAQASIPLGLTLAAEFDSSRTNFGLWWSPVPILRLKAERAEGHTFLGVQLVSPL
jgi:hypothetical protein